jgi:hypothetical protein
MILNLEETQKLVCTTQKAYYSVLRLSGIGEKREGGAVPLCFLRCGVNTTLKSGALTQACALA